MDRKKGSLYALVLTAYRPRTSRMDKNSAEPKRSGRPFRNLHVDSDSLMPTHQART